MAPDVHPLLLLVASVLTSNILLTNFLGLCSFVACSKQVATAVGLGAAVTFVMTFTTALNWALYYLLLQRGALAWLVGPEAAARIDLEFLYFILSIAVIAAFVQLVEMIIDRFSPTLYYALGIFLPLITVNCAILGAALFMVIRKYDFVQSLCYGFGSGLGWWLVILAMSGIRARLRFANIPKPLQGVGITLLITGLMAMAFSAFTGMVKIQ